MIRHVTDSDIEQVRAFLEGYVDTSLFLLSTLAALGPRLGHHLNSGNFRLVEEDGRVVVLDWVGQYPAGLLDQVRQLRDPQEVNHVLA